MARPTLLTEELKEQAYKIAPIVFHYKYIANALGIDEKTLQRYRDANPDFDGQLTKARNDFIRKHMGRAKPEFLLETADREIFGKKQEIAVTGDAIEAIINKYGKSEGVDEVPRIETDESGKDA